jgi:hypothetical protein
MAATTLSFTDTVTRRLLRWSVVSVANGLPLAARRELLLRGVGLGNVVQGGSLLAFDLWHGLHAPEDT